MHHHTPKFFLKLSIIYELREKRKQNEIKYSIKTRESRNRRRKRIKDKMQ
jgi:hypothetical protein